MSLWDELKKRNVVKVGVAYAIVGWLVVQASDILLPTFEAPAWVMRVIVLFVVIGFFIALILAWAYELTPDGIKRTRDVPAGESTRHATGQRLNYVVSACLALAVVVLVIDNYILDGSADMTSAEPANSTVSPVAEDTAAEAASATSDPAAEISLPSVAVLPFVNNSPDPEQEYFADGLSEQLIDTLGGIRDLQVTGRTSSFYFKGKNADLRTIGETLNVEHVLEGSVRKAGNQLRIAAQLTNTQTGFQLWSETYERTLYDIFSIQDDIARSVAQALEITLGVGELGSYPGMTRNVAAYDEFLRAQALYTQFTADSIRSAAEHFDRATALDPTFALAFIELSRMLFDGAVLVPDEFATWRRRSLDAFERARELAPDAPNVLAEAAFRNADRGAWLEAAEFFEEQLPELAAIYARNAQAWLAGGIFLQRAGRSSDAVTYLERARAAEPLEGVIGLYLGEAYAASGAYSAALDEFDRGLELSAGTDYIRGSALLAALAAGDRSEIDRRVAALSESQDIGADINALIARDLDNPAEAVRTIRAIAATETGAGNPLAVNILAHWLAYFGEPEMALELVRTIPITENAALLSFMIWRPLMSDVRKLPEFSGLVRDMGYLDYWGEYGWSDFCRPLGDNRFECS
jgi:TolB-like protein